MKHIAVLFSAFLLLSGCAGIGKKQVQDTSTGPVQTSDYTSDEDKILSMIQLCIDDFNDGRIQEREEYYQIQITPLPLGVSSIPQIDSLADLREEKSDQNTTNSVYTGVLDLEDPYQMVFVIYHPSLNGFWLNGDISFRADPGKIESDRPEFSSAASALKPLTENAASILNTLYGINISYDENGMTEDGYYPFISDDGTVSGINDLMAKAEMVYTREFLEQNYFPMAFAGEHPVYKEMDGRLYVSPNLELNEHYNVTYNIHKIIEVQATDEQTEIDLLVDILGTTQPEIHRITMVNTPDGFRLPNAIY